MYNIGHIPGKVTVGVGDRELTCPVVGHFVCEQDSKQRLTEAKYSMTNFEKQK